MRGVHISALTLAFFQAFTSPKELQHTKSRKKLLLTGTARFNAKPKTGIAFLEENKLIYTDPNEPRPLSLAKFLKSSARMDKRLLGDFLSRQENNEVLKAFMGLLDFGNVSRLKPHVSTILLTCV